MSYETTVNDETIQTTIQQRRRRWKKDEEESPRARF